MRLLSLKKFDLLVFLLLAAVAGGLTCCAVRHGNIPVSSAHHAIPVSNKDTSSPKIEWLPWSGPAFARAKSENKLVFLEITSRWSAWRNDLDCGLSRDPEAAGIIEKNYIALSVDADKRPDIFERYGRGGIPSLSILNPDGYVLASAEAMTPGELKNLLSTLAKNYAKNKAAIDEALKSASEPPERKPKINSADINRLPAGTLAALAEEWDPISGGIGRGRKFPMPETLDFLIYMSAHPEYQKGIDPKPMAQAALNGMAAGLMDGSEGGFCRYSDTPDWKSPHKEKLLGLNSALIITYLGAYDMYGDRKYLEAGESCAGFLKKYLLDKKSGAFMNSRSGPVSSCGQGAGAEPEIDDTLFADANGKAALALLKAYRTTGDKEYLDAALACLDYIINSLYNKKEGVLHYRGADADALALSDQVFPGLAAAVAHQATADGKYLDFAVNIAGICEKKFCDPDGSGFYGYWYGKEPTGLLKTRKKPLAENAKMSELLQTLGFLTGRDEYQKGAKDALMSFIPAYAKYPARSAPVALAEARLMSKSCEFFVTGVKSDPDFVKLLDESFRFEDPDRVVVPLDAARDMERLKALGYGQEQKPVLYICSDSACFPPVRPGEGLESIRALLQKCKEAERQKSYGR